MKRRSSARGVENVRAVRIQKHSWLEHTHASSRDREPGGESQPGPHVLQAIRKKRAHMASQHSARVRGSRPRWSWSGRLSRPREVRMAQSVRTAIEPAKPTAALRVTETEKDLDDGDGDDVRSGSMDASARAKCPRPRAIPALRTSRRPSLGRRRGVVACRAAARVAQAAHARTPSPSI